jgi:hypothetical protein
MAARQQGYGLLIAGGNPTGRGERIGGRQLQRLALQSQGKRQATEGVSAG